MKASQVADVVATVLNKMSRDERKALRELLLVDGECFESVRYLVLGHTMSHRVVEDSAKEERVGSVDWLNDIFSGASKWR